MEDKSIRDNLKSFYEPIQMPGGYSFDHVATLKRIDLYYNSHFERGQYDSQGFRKFFYNIVKPVCDIATKFIDLDTKDIILTSLHPDDEERVWLMQQDLKRWLRDNYFGEKLNWIGENYPKYGSVVLKKTAGSGGKIDGVNIQNLRFNATADTLNNSSFIYELLLMTPRQILEMPWDKKAVKELFDRGKDSQYLISECYFYNSQEGKKWKRYIKGDLFTTVKKGIYNRNVESLFNDPQAPYLSSITLYEDEIDELPYRELHWEKVPGRWLGRGQVEYLFDNQIRRNEVVNVRAKALYLNGLRIFQTRDETVGRNILTDVESGDIIRSNSEISPIDNTERNLAYFDNENNDWEKNKIEKTFTSDISRGENLPSRTPLGVANLQASMVQSYFELKRENFGLFLKKLITEDILPSFAEEANKEHILSFAGQEAEIDRLDSVISRTQVYDAAWNYAMKFGFFPSEGELANETERIRGEIKKNKGRFLNVPVSFYKNAKYLVDVIITGEQIDVGSLQRTLLTSLQILGTNPAVLQDKGLRSILFKMLEMSGISPIELDLLNQQIEQSPPQILAPQGGSVSAAPAGIANPQLVPRKQML